MSSNLTIPAQGELDLLSLGAIIHRLDSGRVPFRKAHTLSVHVSGGEFNVAANLADCFGLRTGIAAAMVRYPVGDLIAERVRAMGVRPFYKYFDHDGARGPNMATVYSDQGMGIRPPVVFYNRSNEAAALLQPGDFDWDAIFGLGVRWFHSGGLFASLSATTAEVIIEALQAARRHGVVTSFDLNYREKLWKAQGALDKAQSIFKRIVENVDVLVGNEEDLQKALGVAGPEAGKGAALDTAAFFDTINRVVEQYPDVKVVATTLREVHSTNRHTWSAVAWFGGEHVVAPTTQLDVLDRVGGGDGFASGLIYGLLAGESPEQSVRLGWAHGALITTFPGDTTMATVEDVKAFAKGGSARIQR
jgi:2-dehydro-3-deoxygluconokinase